MQGVNSPIQFKEYKASTIFQAIHCLLKTDQLSPNNKNTKNTTTPFS